MQFTGDLYFRGRPVLFNVVGAISGESGSCVANELGLAPFPEQHEKCELRIANGTNLVIRLTSVKISGSGVAVLFEID